MDSLFRLLAYLHNWDAEQVKYLTPAQALIYVQDVEPSASAFKRGKKFRTRAEALAHLRKGKK